MRRTRQSTTPFRQKTEQRNTEVRGGGDDGGGPRLRRRRHRGNGRHAGEHDSDAKMTSLIATRPRGCRRPGNVCKAERRDRRRADSVAGGQRRWCIGSSWNFALLKTGISLNP